MSALQESIDHWRTLAQQNRAMASYERSVGIDLSAPGQSPGDHRAKSYEDTARALELELRTGLPHCSSCFGPHPNHKHGHVG